MIFIKDHDKLLMTYKFRSRSWCKICQISSDFGIGAVKVQPLSIRDSLPDESLTRICGSNPLVFITIPSLASWLILRHSAKYPPENSELSWSYWPPPVIRMQRMRKHLLSASALTNNVKPGLRSHSL